jgi:hypothetical protein
MSSQPILYKIYQSVTNRTINGLRKSGHRSFKKATDGQILRLLIDEMWKITDVYNSVDFKIYCEEHYWGVMGKCAIFPESDDLVYKLLSAKYDCNSGAIFSLPFESFVLAMPRGLTYLGQEIQSCLVTTGLYETFCQPHVEHFCKHIGINSPNVTLEKDIPGARQISLVYRDIENHDLAVQCWMLSDMWPTMLSCKSVEEFHSRFAKEHSTMADSAIQFTLYKLIAGLSIYNTATEGEYLDAGLPGQKPGVRIEGSPGSRPNKHFILRENDIVKKEMRSEPGQHYRSWHFRNLRDQRFYHGKYECWEPGSRWVFVSDAVINGQLDPHTMADSSN